MLWRDGHWPLSPAYDIQTQRLGGRYQCLQVGKQGTVSILLNALSDARRFML